MWLPIPAAALVQRELLEGLREKKVFLLLLSSNVLLFAVFGLGVLSVGNDPAALAQITPVAFIALCVVWYGLAVLFIPAMAGASICIEKQQGSFDLLWTSLVRPSGVIAAKMVNILSIFLLLVISNLPIVGVLFFFVGVDWVQFLWGFGLVFLTAVACAAAGLMCSAYFYRTLAAFTASYAVTLCFLGAPYWFVVLMTELLFNWPYRGETLNDVMMVFCPPLAFGATLNSPGNGNMLLGSVVYQLVFILVMLRLAWRFVKRPPRPMQVDTRKPIDDSEQLRARRRTFPFYLVDPQRRRATISDGSNPMCAKEIYSGLLARPTWRIRTFYVSLVLAFPFSLFGAVANYHEVGNEIFNVCWFITIFVVLLAPGVIAHALPKEYELGNMDLLRTTLLSPWQILMGKLFSAVIMLSPFVLGVLCGLGLMLMNMVWADPLGFLQGGAEGCVLIAVNVAWALTLSLRTSLYFRRTLPALVASYIVGLFFFAGIPLLFVLFGELVVRPYSHIDWQLMEPLIGFTSPLLVVPFRADTMNSSAMLYLLLDLLAFAALSVLVFASSVRQFKRTHMRDR